MPPSSFGHAGAVQPFAASFWRTPRTNSYSSSPSPLIAEKPFQSEPNSWRIQLRSSWRHASSSAENRKSIACSPYSPSAPAPVAPSPALPQFVQHLGGGRGGRTIIRRGVAYAVRGACWLPFHRLVADDLLALKLSQRRGVIAGEVAEHFDAVLAEQWRRPRDLRPRPGDAVAPDHRMLDLAEEIPRRQVRVTGQRQRRFHGRGGHARRLQGQHRLVVAALAGPGREDRIQLVLA